MAVDLTLDNKALAEAYDAISHAQFKNGCMLIVKLGMKSGDTVLDIGCGTGRLGRYAMDIIGDSGQYIGLDPLKERINIANEKNEYKNANFHIGIAEDLSLVPSDSVDIIVLNSVFHWVLDKPKALLEIKRVLKSGGKVGITTTAKELNSITGVGIIADTVLKREDYAGRVKEEESFSNKHSLTTTELIQQLINADLKVEDIQVQLSQRKYPTAKDVVLHSEASTFGNYLNHVSDELREQAKGDIILELEKHCGKDGVQFDFYMIFAIAKKR